jgi:hypothetical protein
MIQHGVALMRLASSPTGCGAGDMIEEFYVVVTDGVVTAKRFNSYAEAFKVSEKLCTARADVA